jgi:hypothetical protein
MKTMFPHKSLNKLLQKTPRNALIFVGLLAACSPAALPLVETPIAFSPAETANHLGAGTAGASPAATATVDLNLDKYVYVPMIPRDAIRPI